MATARFTLTDNNGSVVFGTEYLSNWDELEISLTRSDSYRARERSLTNTFAFIGAIRKRIIGLLDDEGSNAYLSLKIEIGNDNRNEFSYDELGKDGYGMIADFNDIEIDETTVEISFEDSDYQQKIDTYGDEDIEITTETTVYDDDVDLSTSYEDRLKTIYMHDRVIQLNNSFSAEDCNLSNYWKSGTSTVYCVPEMTAYEVSDSDNAQTAVGYLVNDYSNIYSDSCFFLTSDSDYTVTVYTEGSIASNLIGSGASLKLVRLDEDFDETEIIAEETLSYAYDADEDYYIIDLNYNFGDIEVAEDESLRMYIEFYDISTSTTMRVFADEDNDVNYYLYANFDSYAAISTESYTELKWEDQLTYEYDSSTDDYVYAIPGLSYESVEDSEILETTGAIGSFSDVDVESSYLIYQATTDKVLSIYLHGTIVSSNSDIKLHIVVADEDFEQYSLTVYSGFTLTERTDGNYDVYIDYELDYLEVDEGYSLFIYFIMGDYSSDQTLLIGPDSDESQSLTFEITSTYDTTDTTANCILPHDFFTHWLEMITGVENSFYSEYFGREELGYDSDGEGAFIAILDGYMIRNAPIEDYPFTANFEDILDDFIKMRNLVAWIDYRGGKEYFRIEKYEDYYDLKNTVVNIGTVYNNIRRSINSDLTYSAVYVGADDTDLDEEYYGLNFVNGDVEFTTPLTNADNELDLLISGQIEAYLIENVRRDQYDENSDSSGSYDEDIFYIFAKEATDKGTDLEAVKDENFYYVGGINNPETAYNLDLAPHLTLLERWGIVINGCLQQKTN